MTVYAITDTKKGRTGIAPTYLQTTPAPCPLPPLPLFQSLPSPPFPALSAKRPSPSPPSPSFIHVPSLPFFTFNTLHVNTFYSK